MTLWSTPLIPDELRYGRQRLGRGLVNRKTPFTRYNRLDNRLYRVNKHPTGSQTGCQTGLTMGLTTGCIV